MEPEDDGYVALCPEVDIASQGATMAVARANIEEALELLFETAAAAGFQDRSQNEMYVTQVEVEVAWTGSFIGT